MNEVTYCRDCDHVEPTSRKGPQWKWLCMECKAIEGHGFVDPDVWTNGEPYLRCKDVNGGYCKLFKPAATRQTKMEI